MKPLLYLGVVLALIVAAPMSAAAMAATSCTDDLQSPAPDDVSVPDMPAVEVRVVEVDEAPVMHGGCYGLNAHAVALDALRFVSPTVHDLGVLDEPTARALAYLAVDLRRLIERRYVVDIVSRPRARARSAPPNARAPGEV